jgi:hypothetical protein
MIPLLLGSILKLLALLGVFFGTFLGAVIVLSTIAVVLLVLSMLVKISKKIIS